MNKVILIGNIGKDPSQRTAGNKIVASLSLATTVKWKDGKRTEWHNIVAWEKLGEFVMRYCKKGEKIGVEGEIRYEKYLKDGEEKYITKIYADKIHKLTWSDDDSEKKNETNKLEIKEEDDEIPF